MKVPGYWTNTKLENVNGVVWFRKKVVIPSSMTGKAGELIFRKNS